MFPTAERTEIANKYLNLTISPSISHNTFAIKIPYYATSVDIYNRTGKLVKTMTADKSELIWKGYDESGKLMPQGVYFIKTKGKEKTEVKKLLLIR